MTAQAPFPAVVFDLDDTLYPERQYVRSGYVAVVDFLRNQFGPGHPISRLTPPAEEWLWIRFLRLSSPSAPAGQHPSAFDALNSEFDLGLSAEHILQLVSIYRNHMPAIRPYEGIAHTLGVLAGDYRLGLLSDGYQPGQSMKFEALRLGRFFDAVIFTDELGRNAWKPSPIAFQAMAERLSMNHSQCVYVGDNPSKDFLAPNVLGWKTIQWLRQGQLHADKAAPAGGEAAYVVRDAGELRAAIRA